MRELTPSAFMSAKKADQHAMTQDGINALLADRAATGKVVARLKGGDPFVFGRGGEEAEYLRERNIPFVVIPGVLHRRLPHPLMREFR